MKILVVQTRPGIGDFCIFLPYIHALSRIENLKITVLTKKRSAAKDLTNNDPYIDEIIYLPEKIDLKFIQYIRSMQFEKSYIFHYGMKFYLLSKLCKIKKIFFYGFFKKKTNISIFPKKKMKDWLKIEDIQSRCELFFPKNLENRNNIILGIGGSGPTKKWDVKNYINLIKKINEYYPGFKFIVAGGADQINDFNFIKNNLGALSISSICHLNISESIKNISSSKLYIGNDTGFMHLSGMLGIKSFGLFGDTPTNYSDYNSLIKAIIPEGRLSISHGSRAMNEIKVDWVFSQIKNSLN